MSLYLKLNNNSLEFEYTDLHYNLYRYVLLSSDPFVINYMNKDVSKAYHFIHGNKYEVEKHDDYVIIKYDEPIILKYKLQMVNKSSNDEKLNLILKKMNGLETEITRLKQRANDFDEQLENGVVLSGFEGGIIDKNETILMLNYYNDHLFGGHCHIDINSIPKLDRNGHLHMNGYKFNNFFGSTLKPLKYLKNIRMLLYCQVERVYNDCNPEKGIIDESEFKYISFLENLEVIHLFKFSQITNLDFLENCKKLREIVIWNFPNLTNIDKLKQLPKLSKLKLEECPKIINMDGFSSSITILKK